MKLKVFSLSMIGLLVLSAGGVIFSTTSNKSFDEAEAYTGSSLPTTIDLNPTASADIRDYYSDLLSLSNSEKTGTNLLKNLKPILKNGQKYYSYENGTNIWKMYEITDRDWDKSPASAISGYNSTTKIITGYKYQSKIDTSNPGPFVHALYNNRNIDNQAYAWNSHGDRDDPWTIEREHVWPKSQGFSAEGAGGARGDPMHLMAAEGSANGAHSAHPYGFVNKQKKYTDVGSTHANATGNLVGISKTKGSGTVFEPQDCDKGDIARAVFYMAARYNYLGGNDTIDTDNPNLELVDAVVEKSSYTSSTTNPGQMGVLFDLLEWNRLDPPDEYEIQRNDLLYTNYTNNRNPFIDFPDWAEYIWGNKAGTSYANPSSDSIHTFSTGGGEPPEPQNIPVTGISIIPSASIKVGESTVLSPDISPNNATNKAVTWHTDDANIATVDNGRVTGVAVGTVGITAVTVDGLLEATCEVEVKAADAVDVSSDTITNSLISLGSGSGYRNWTSSITGDSGVVYNGASAVNGNAIQLNNNKDDPKIGIITTSSNKNIRRISVVWNSSTSSGKSLTIYGKNTEYTSTSDLYSEDTRGTSLGTITYGTSTELIVSGDYKYVGIYSNGATYLDSITFDWNIPVSSVELDEDSIQLDLNGDLSATINATVLPENASNKNISWSISDDSVATVDNGVITAKKVGEAVVIVTSEDGSKTATCNVEVIDSTPVPTKDVTIDTSIMAIASANGWENSGWYGVGEANAISIDENISFYTTGTTNNGRYYTNGNNWRLYHAGEGNIVIKAGDGYTIKSVTLNFSINKDGYLIDPESHTVESGQVNDVNASSVTYTVAGPENGQVRITNISVTYSNSQTPSIELSSIAVTDYVSSFTTGDTFNFGGTVTATYSDSTTKNVTGSASFSGYDMSKAGTQTVTVAYTEAEITKTTSYEITVNEPTPVVILESISITTNPTKVEYETGETFSSEGLVVTATYSDSSTKDVTLSVALSGYDMSKAGTQTVMVSYTEDEITKTTNYEITVSEPVVTLQSIEITTKPSKLNYEIGEELDLTGMVVTATYSDGSTKPVSGYTVSGYDKNKADTQTITVTYQELTATFTVTVNKMLSSISISNQTSTFEKGDTFTFGGEVTANYSDGSTKNVTSLATFTGYDMSKAGNQTVTVTYVEDGATKTTTYQITVNEPAPVVTLESITITTRPTKLEFEKGEEFSSEGLVVIATYSDSSTKDVTSSVTLSGYDMSTAGNQTVTITYIEGEATKTATYQITVNEPAPVVTLTGISITSEPTKLNYEIGETFSSEGLVVTAIYSDGTSEAISDYSLSTVDTSTVGEKTVTITYQGHTATFTINVYKTLSSISVSGQTTTFEKGDTFTFGGVVTATYTDGSTLDVTSSVTFSGYDMSKAGVQTVTVTYVEGDVRKTVTYQITVNEPVVPVTLTGISITTNPTKLEYVTGEDLDLTGMVVTATYSDGSTSHVNDYTVSGYDKNNIGTQTITVTYQGLTKTFTVVVNDSLKDQKDAAVAALNEYYNSLDLSKYSFDNLVKLYSELKAGESAIKNAKSVDEINAALANAKNALASIPQEETPEPPTAPTNTCGGNIAATSAILSLLALLGVALVTYKKRKQ